jgi:hypothetical protein
MRSHRVVTVALLAGLLLAGVPGAVAGGGPGVDSSRQVATTTDGNATLTGTVSWPNGTAVTRGTVFVHSAENVTATAGVSSQGEYELSLAPGEYTVVAASGDVHSAPATVRVAAGETRQLARTVEFGGGAPPAPEEVSARIREPVSAAATGDSVDVFFSSEAESVLDVRRLRLSFAESAPAGWVEVATLGSGPAPLPGPALTHLYLSAASPGAVANATVMVRVSKADLGAGTPVAYQYRDGAWRSVPATRAVVTPDSTWLRVETDVLGHLAVAAETTTTTATPWTPSETPSSGSRDDGLLGSGVRTGLALVALGAAVLLAVRAGE